MYDMSAVGFTGDGGEYMPFQRPPTSSPPEEQWSPTSESCAYQTDPAYAQAFYPPPPYHQQQDLTSYTSPCYAAAEYPDVNSLEPSLFYPQQQHFHQQQQQIQQMQQQQQMPHGPFHNSPTGSSSHNSTTSDDSEEFSHWHPYKKASPPVAEKRGAAGKPLKKRKPKRDPNEPQKPVSAYALFFRDTQAAIKGQNPNASFGEVSKIVASMWDTLETDAKNAYKQKTETAKKEYLRQLAAYRANLIGRNGLSDMDFRPPTSLHQTPQPQRLPSSPDSTTVHSTGQEAAARPPLCSAGDKTLASLIAEPPAQRVLTATTTLTVPHHHYPQAQGGRLPSGGKAAQPPPSGAEWGGDWRPSSGLVQHCRDVFTVWAPTADPALQPLPQTGGEVAQ